MATDMLPDSGVERQGELDGWVGRVEDARAPVAVAKADDAAWLEHTPRFREYRRHIGHVFEQRVSEDDVKPAIGEWHGNGVAGDEGVVGEALYVCQGARPVEHLRLHIEPHHHTGCGHRCESNRNGARPAAEVE